MSGSAFTHLPDKRTPVSTYRIQLGPDQGFDAAREALDYLDALGVTDIYLSPILQAAPGSTHGYDVVDPTSVSEDLGGRDAFIRLADAAHEHKMGVIVDVVPNHMGVPTPIFHNRPLWSVLKEGPNSPYASWFDGADDDSDGILMPFLGERIGTVLANDELSLEYRVIPGMEDEGEQPVLCYYEHVFPVRAGTENLPLPMCVAQQYYRLAYWKVAAEELNFRRFFDVDTLLAVRVEDPEVFDATHAELLDLYHSGYIDAFRIDHPDGLADPRGYMRRLSMATGGAWIAAEKILEPDESLPDDWPVAGTTGYDASWRISALHIDPAGNNELASLAQDLTDDIPGSLGKMIADAKREITHDSLIAEVYRIAQLAYQICRNDIMLRDHTQGWIAQCITEMVIAFPRYRAYVVPGEPATEEAVRLVEQTAKEARKHLDEQLVETLDVVVDLILGREVGSQSHAQRDLRDEFVVRFQQVCGATTAKGMEDTAFYRWTHLMALNEVGGSPAAWALNPDDFHQWCSTMAETWPATMVCGTTHDNKRSEDVRERMGVISQFAHEWRDLVSELHERITEIPGHAENMLWQTLAGTWMETGPIESERLTDYMIKASREQKLWTNWTNPDEEAETALVQVIRDVYDDEAIMESFADWYRLTSPAARVAILARKAIQLTCLGVADCYNSCETTQNYLVDPDNRRPADFAALADLMARVEKDGPDSLAGEKLHTTREILRLRRRHPEAFVGRNALYRPLPSSTGHVVSFARGEHVVTVAARLYRGAQRIEGFTDHTVVLPEGSWVDVLTNRTYSTGEVEVRDLLARFPCAVLEKTDGETTPQTRGAVSSADTRPLFGPDVAGDDLGQWLTRRLTDDGE